MFLLPVQHSASPNQFVYLGRQLDWWYQANGVDSAAKARELRISNQPGPPATRAGGPKVSIVGENFAGVMTVRGMGAGTSEINTQYVSFSFKGALTLTFANFAQAKDSLGANAPVSIVYEFTLMEGNSTPPTSILDGPVSGTDAGLNGSTLSYDSKGTVKHGYIRIRRTVSVTQAAKGGQQYTANGTIVLSIN